HTMFSRDWSSDVCSSDLGSPGRSARAVFQGFGTVGAIAVDPFRQSRAGDAGFGSVVGDGSAIIFDTLDQAESSGRGQRRITVGRSEESGGGRAGRFRGAA